MPLEEQNLMSIGKYISLEEARKEKKLDRFAKEHTSEGNKILFDKLFQAMAVKKLGVLIYKRDLRITKEGEKK